MKRLLVVCRYNQARSIVIGAVLRKLFPDIDVVTAGIQAPQGKVIPEVTTRLCHQWRLPTVDRISMSSDSLDLELFDAVLAADEFVYTELQDKISPQKLYSLQDFAGDSLLMPIDPSGMNYQNFTMEIAKAIILALRWMNSIKPYTQSTIYSYLFESELSLQQWITTKEAQDYKNLIDVNLSIPNTSTWKVSDRQIHYLDLRRNSWQLRGEEEKQMNCVWASKYEVDFVADVLFSQRWLEFLSYACSVGSMALLAVIEQGGEKKAENLLGLVHSSSTRVIS